MTDDVVVQAAEGIGTVRLNRPHRGNSVTPSVVTRMGESVRELDETDDVRSIVLTGTGKVFCAGADVQEMYAVHIDEGAFGLMDYLVDVWMPAVQRTVRALWSVRKPLVAAFNGAATAGGLDFGLACDARVAASTARFAESYVNLGMVPVAGGVFLLPRLVGLGAATELIAGGELIGAERALALGMVNEVCEPDELPTRSAELANRLAKGPAATFTRLKQTLRGAETEELERVLKESYQTNVELLAREDVRERVVAVMERYSLSVAASPAY